MRGHFTWAQGSHGLPAYDPRRTSRWISRSNAAGGSAPAPDVVESVCFSISQAGLP